MDRLMPTLPMGHALQARYQIIKKLGSGGYGSVYLAEDVRLRGRHVAVKELSDPSPAAQQLFKQEAQVLASLDHPGLVRVSDFFQEGRSYYLVMDFVAGRDLLDVVVEAEKAHRKLPVEQAVDLMTQVCDAVAYLHHQKPPIIHRDIKPNNVRITRKGRAILVDFGIAKIDPKAKTQMMAKAVSQGFSPPEQYGTGGGGTDTRSDVYALGATLYCLLTVSPPPDSFDRLMRGTVLTDPSKLNRAVSKVLEEVVLKAMALNIAHRYADAGEMLAALKAASGQPRSGSAKSQRQSRPNVQIVSATPVAAPQPAPPVRQPPGPTPSAGVVDIKPASEITCTRCGALCRPNAQFCPQCGATVDKERRCPSCGAPYRAGARFCSRCRTALPDTGPRPGSARPTPVPGHTPPPPSIQVEPSPATASQWLGEAQRYLQAGDYRKAADAYEHALDLKVSTAALFANLGRCYCELKRFDDAVAVLERGTHNHLRDAGLQAQLAFAYLSAGRIPHGVQALERAYELDPNNFEVAQNLVAWLFDLDRYADAVPVLEHLVRDRTVLKLREQLAVAYLMTDDIEKAKAVIGSLFQASGYSPVERNFLGGLLNFKEGKLRWAMSKMQRVLREDEQRYLAHYFVGELFLEQRRWREALAAYQESVALNDKYVAAHVKIALCHKALGKNAEALEVAKRVLALNSKHPQALNLVANLDTRSAP
ncbi:MAG: protein kinase [Anaerolineae bacterium]|nr:protein kinase [Anaerolineae bacterium]